MAHVHEVGISCHSAIQYFNTLIKAKRVSSYTVGERSLEQCLLSIYHFSSLGSLALWPTAQGSQSRSKRFTSVFTMKTSKYYCPKHLTKYNKFQAGMMASFHLLILTKNQPSLFVKCDGKYYFQEESSQRLAKILVLKLLNLLFPCFLSNGCEMSG